MKQLKMDSPATVNEGGSYPVRLTITNQSYKAGLPVEAVLGVGIAAGTESISLIPPQLSSEYFAPNETRTFSYTMIVPSGSSGQLGTITAWIEAPTGLVLASVSEGITIVPPGGINLGEILILGVGGKPLVNVGIDIDGLPCGTLVESIVAEKLAGVIINWCNQSITFSYNYIVGLMFYLIYEPTFPVEPPYNMPPGFRGFSSPPESAKVYAYPALWSASGPFETSASIGGVWAAGYYSQGVYDGRFIWNKYLWNGNWIESGSFRIRNLFRCTGKGIIQ